MAATALAQLGARLGLRPGAAELQASLNVADYAYGVPSEAQLQRLRQQNASQAGRPAAHTAGAADGAVVTCGTRAAAQGAAAPSAPSAVDAAAKSAAHAHNAHPHHCPLADDLFGGQLDIDDDCLRLLLGEDGDEAGPCASAAGSGKGPCSGSAVVASGGSGASQKSSATGADGHAAVAAGGAGEADAASLPAGAATAQEQAQQAQGQEEQREEDDDIAMLFAEYRGAVSLDPLEQLHMLGASAAHHHHHAPSPLAAAAAAAADEESDDSGSAAGGACTPASKRAKATGTMSGAGGGFAASPSVSAGGGMHLALSLHMDYEKAAESINLELLGNIGSQQRKSAAACSEGFDAMLPLLSPILDFATMADASGDASADGFATHPAGIDTPDTPDSLASGSDSMVPLPPMAMQRQDSCGKRKRAVRQ